MAETQISSNAIQKRDLSWRDALWLATYCLRSAFELARARIEFSSFDVRQIAENSGDATDTAAPPSAFVPLLRIQFVLPRIANRLPWRTDCLIQAMAAKNWLRGHKQDSTIVLGVKHPADSDFGAHAWLICDGSIVTGGDVSEYEAMTGGPRPASENVPEQF